MYFYCLILVNLLAEHVLQHSFLKPFNRQYFANKLIEQCADLSSIHVRFFRFLHKGLVNLVKAPLQCFFCDVVDGPHVYNGSSSSLGQ